MTSTKFQQYTTIGDGNKVDCPYCDYEVDVTDFGIDGCLEPGFKFECDNCEKPIEILDTEYSLTIVCVNAEMTNEEFEEQKIHEDGPTRAATATRIKIK